MIFDILLAVILLVLAWYAMSSPDLFLAVILFITLGLLVSLAWVRLGAPDVAMAEAAVGSGLTGALLLSTLSHMRRMQEAPREDEMPVPESDEQEEGKSV